jgi:diketogulonate reductase-like aldo/keto reductase
MIVMEYRETKEGISIPVIGLGTFRIGGVVSADYSHDKEGVEAIKTAIDLGYTHLDTAEAYAEGHTEELVGKAIKEYDRGELFITTKVFHNHLRYEEVLNALEGSLERMGTDYMDLFLVHWPNPDVPLKETMKAMEYLANEGKTRLIGVSNFSVEQMEEAESYLEGHHLVTNQVHYSLLFQDPRGEVLPYCQEENILLMAYSPLEKGALAKPGNITLDDMADKYGRSPAQIALNWLISQDKVVAIPKAVKVEHLKENMAALGWKLSKKDMDTLTKSFR